MLTDREAGYLVGVLEGECENTGVGRDDLFRGKEGFCPEFGLEKDGAGNAGFGAGFWRGVEESEGDGRESTDVVACHHCFGRFGV